MNHKKLSKTMSRALRHDPDRFGLTLDSDGSVALTALIHSLRHHGFPTLCEKDIHAMMAASDKKRFSIENGSIRALYGHSLKRKIERPKAQPPAILYHGTSRHALKSIRSQGLLPMGRQYVHLSADQATAAAVGRRHDANPVILTVDTVAARAENISFYYGNDTTWLADAIPARCLHLFSRT